MLGDSIGSSAEDTLNELVTYYYIKQYPTGFYIDKYEMRILLNPQGDQYDLLSSMGSLAVSILA
jgi:hypothetical protein